MVCTGCGCIWISGCARRRAGADRTFAREPPAAVVAPVAFPALLAGAAQVLVQLPALALVRPDIAIDRLVADPEFLVEPQPPGDLLGAPVLAHQRLDPRPVARREPPVASGVRTPAPRIPLGQ